MKWCESRYLTLLRSLFSVSEWRSVRTDSRVGEAAPGVTRLIFSSLLRNNRLILTVQ